MTDRNRENHPPPPHNALGSPVLSDGSLTYTVLAILAVAFGLRVWGIGFGLPYDFTPDEIHEIVRALKLGSGEYSWTPGKGGLYFFLFVEYGFLYVYWWLTGVVDSPTDFALRFMQDPTAFYLAGRITVAVMGTATCYLLFLLGKRIRDSNLGLIAAILAATAYYHAYWSHYINVDIGMVLVMYLGILAYMHYESAGRTRWLVTAGILCGIAFAFKFNGAVAIIPIGIAIITPLAKWKFPARIFKEGLILILATTLTATVVAPENIVMIGKVADNFETLIEPDDEEYLTEEQAAEAELRATIQDVTIFTGHTYAEILLRPHNILITLLALVGAGIGLWKRYRWDLILLSHVFIYLAVMTIADRPAEERYMLAITPALWLLSARAVTELLATRTAAIIGLCVLVCSFSLYPLVRQNLMWALPDTRVLAKVWVEENIAPDSKLLIDGMRFRYIHSPQLIPNKAAVMRRVTDASTGRKVSRGLTSKSLMLYADAMEKNEGPKYDMYSTEWGITVKPLSYYPKECFDFVVISSYMSRRYDSPGEIAKYPESAEFYAQISKHPQYKLVYSVNPSEWEIIGPAIDVYAVDSDCE